MDNMGGKYKIKTKKIGKKSENTSCLYVYIHAHITHTAFFS